ncbi:hypothetical protein KIS4809_1610 [Bacillus sp. ZZV12-4809]|nr:hypothetical protein KIS4809_1610 [Bacillus sp. ZZV12-4809]
MKRSKNLGDKKLLLGGKNIFLSQLHPLFCTFFTASDANINLLSY